MEGRGLGRGETASVWVPSGVRSFVDGVLGRVVDCSVPMVGSAGVSVSA